MTKIDFKKELNPRRRQAGAGPRRQQAGASAKKVEVVDVRQMNFLMIDGEGDPNTSQGFQDFVMERREFLKAAGAGVCLAVAGCISASGTGFSRKPNIVLCMADDQGWGDMAYNGHPVLKTPNFDAMAASALRFDRFYAAAPVCSPTRGSVMTGRHPNRFGCFKWGHTLRPQEITIAEALKTAGYVTGHFGKWHLGSVRKGSPVNPGASGFDEWFSAPNFFDNDPILSREGVAVQTQGESSMVTVDAALEFIGKHSGGPRPFLAVVWFGSPHGPHQAIEEDRVVYNDQDKKLQHFYGEITGMDRAFGKLRKGLRTLGIDKSTILWYCSDNGGLPKVGTTGGRGNKGNIYEGGLRVPAILEWPVRISNPRATEVPCNTSDIYPTLLEITGVRMKNQPSGIILPVASAHRAKSGCLSCLKFRRQVKKVARPFDCAWMPAKSPGNILKTVFPAMPPGSTGRGSSIGSMTRKEKSNWSCTILQKTPPSKRTLSLKIPIE